MGRTCKFRPDARVLSPGGFAIRHCSLFIVPLFIVPLFIVPFLLALGFVLADEEVDTAIVGTSNLDHMKTNIRLVEHELPLPAKVVQELHRRYDQLESS